MKAVICPRYGGPEVLQLKEVPIPTPKPNEIRIKVHATTVTVADFRVRSFTIPPSFWIPGRLMLGITKPRNAILGVEVAGEIDAVGEKVRNFRKGDSVFSATLMKMGGYAEYVCIPAEGPTSIKPPTISYEEAAAISVGGRTALHHLRKAKIAQGQKVLVYGASGSVGTYTVQLAKYFGAHVTGVCSSQNIDLVKSLGADHVIDYTRPDFVQQLERYDIVFAAIDKIPFALCRDILTEEGVYVNVTAPMKSLAMIWTTLTTRKKVITGNNSPETPDDLHFLIDRIVAGDLKVVIDRSYTLEEIVEAHRYVDQGHKKGNVVVKVI